MKRIFNLFILSLMISTIYSCSKINSEPIGKWKDNIKLSQKSATVSAEKNIVSITTDNSGWWITYIKLDQEIIDLTNTDKTDKKFKIANSDFQVERKNGNLLLITINENNTGLDRTLYIGLQNGDYFDGITITQKK